MLRKATLKDYETIQALLHHDSSRALFILGDIETYGFDEDFQEVWLDEDAQGIHVVYLRYYENLVWYVIDEIKDLMACETRVLDPRITKYNATQAHYDCLPNSLLSKIQRRSTFFCECRELPEQNHQATLAKESDARAILDGLETILEFQENQVLSYDLRLKRLEEQIRTEANYCFIIKEHEQVIAHASSSAHSKSGAMVIGVFTRSEYRQKGYARQVVLALTQHCLKRGKVPCLFYDNPQAGRLYHDLGYKTIDHWIMGSRIKSELD